MVEIINDPTTISQAENMMVYPRNLANMSEMGNRTL
jgi:hypothetical protein